MFQVIESNTGFIQYSTKSINVAIRQARFITKLSKNAHHILNTETGEIVETFK